MAGLRTFDVRQRFGLIGAEFRWTGIGFQQPGGAVRIVALEFLIFRRTQVACPHNARTVDIGCVVNPLFLENVLRPVTDKHQ